MSVDQLGGQDRGSIAGLTGHHQRRRAHSRPLRQQGQVGLVFDLPLGGRERSFVLEVAKGEPPPDPEQQVGVALLAAERLHEQPSTAGHRDEERRRPARVDAGRRHGGTAQPHLPQRHLHLVR